MPAKEWMVVSGPAQNQIQSALFEPIRDLCFNLGVSNGHQTFTARLEVLAIWAGNSKAENQCPWDAMYGYKGRIKGCQQLARNDDPESVAVVEVSFYMNGSKGQLNVVCVE